MRRMSGRYSCVELGGGGAGRGVSNCEPRYEPRRSERACQRDRGEAVLLEPRAPGAECSLMQLNVSRRGTPAELSPLLSVSLKSPSFSGNRKLAVLRPFESRNQERCLRVGIKNAAGTSPCSPAEATSPRAASC